MHAIADYCFKKLNTNNVSVKTPEGGFYIMPDFTKVLKHKFKSSSEMCAALLKETGVAVLPGSDFGFPEDRLALRLSYVDFNGAEFFKICEQCFKRIE